ncbi:uncharacterized protein BJX67DRAFT_359638 [Aspergillus lucknowensis]|uniref:Uncharacterized protein n=1 Tax=Aspergillus lucknowensis TaxID=176173 RepID=A0ABR4LKG5_9EURO
MSNDSSVSRVTNSRLQYDPDQQALNGEYMDQVFEPIRVFDTPDGRKWGHYRLTKKGNDLLRSKCRSHLQKAVWNMPCYEIQMGPKMVQEYQIVSARTSYINAILIATRGLQMRSKCTRDKHKIFRETYRLPGFCEGACSGCKWQDRGRICPYRSTTEERYEPGSNPVPAIPLPNFPAGDTLAGDFHGGDSYAADSSGAEPQSGDSHGVTPIAVAPMAAVPMAAIPMDGAMDGIQDMSVSEMFSLYQFFHQSSSLQ